MQRSHFAMSALALLCCVHCKAETTVESDGVGKSDAAIDVDAKAEAAAHVDIRSRIGGTIVAVGDYRVELLAFVDGRVHAVLMDLEGELIANPGDARLAVSLAAEGDARAEVSLDWNPAVATFVGQVDAQMRLVPGPVTVELALAGDVHAGHLAQLAVAVEATHAGQVVVAGDYSIELAVEGDFVHAFVFDAAGKAHATGELDLNLHIGSDADLVLAWDPPSASYKAQLKAGVSLEAKPIVLEVRTGAKVAVAAVHSFRATATVEQQVAARGEVKVQAKAPSVSARADASKNANAKGEAKVGVQKSASAKGSASTSSGSGSAGAKASGSAKASFKIGSK